MRNGEGSITEVLKKDGSSHSPRKWRVVVSYTAHVPDGEGGTKSVRRRITRIVKGPKKAAFAKRQEIIDEHDDDGNELDAYQRAKRSGGSLDASTVTFSKMVDMWKEQRITENSASVDTIERNYKSVKKFEEYLGPFPLGEITQRLVEETANKVRKQYNLSASTLQNHLKLVKSVFEKAVDYDLIPKSPCARIKLPKREPVLRRSLSELEANKFAERLDKSEVEEFERLVSAQARRRSRGLSDNETETGQRRFLRGIHNLAYLMAIRIGFNTGMRVGEVLALAWRHVDLERGRIQVCRTVCHHGAIKDMPKTSHSFRLIDIDEITVEHLRLWRERQTHELAKIGIEVGEDTLIVCTDCGSIIDGSHYNVWWRRWCKANGFDALKFHELRHTHATLLLSNGVDVKTVQNRLGHSSPSITLEYYAHAIPENDRAAANVFALITNKKDYGKERLENMSIQVSKLLESKTASPAVSPDSDSANLSTAA